METALSWVDYWVKSREKTILATLEDSLFNYGKSREKQLGQIEDK
jgi:hypothetical protein